jgi:DnaJ-class molecular chaperone
MKLTVETHGKRGKIRIVNEDTGHVTIAKTMTDALHEIGRDIKFERGKEKRAVEHKPAESPPEKRGNETCGNCNGSGIYRGGGRVENGKYIGFEGPCFRCEGKGYQNDADRRRNWGYDQNRRIPA